MALLVENYSLNNGLSSDTAYVKIDGLAGGTEKLTLDIGVYVSKDISDNNGLSIDKKYIDFKPDMSEDAKNYHTQGYEVMKTLPEFQGASNILEEGQLI